MQPAVHIKGARSVAVAVIAFLACGADVDKSDDYKTLRLNMVAQQIASRGVEDRNVLEAMRQVPRHRFVPPKWRDEAYDDHPLPIGHEQTISQPYIVAYMTEALHLKPGDKVLEVGTGSGYQAAVLAAVGADVYSIEIIPELGRPAAELLSQLGFRVEVRIGDGYRGWPEAAPFDGIIVTAAPREIPAPLISQLKDGGRMVIPVGRFFQDLKILRKKGGRLIQEDSLPVRFVPMTGAASP